MTFVIDYPEGATPLDPNERDGLKHGYITTQGELDTLEQANIIAGRRWLEGLRRPNVLTDTFALQLHKRLFGDVWRWAGALRRTEKNIGIDPLHIPVELRTCIDNARYWFDHETYPPLEAAVRFHHRLTFIHPFSNGNGRHARIMTEALLERVYGIPPIDWARGEDLQNNSERRRQYIAALKAADGGEFELLFAFAGVNQ